MRLQKVLAQAGVASRRRAETLIAEGRVEVNGQIVREQGVQVEPDRDLVRVDGRLLELERKVHYVLYKPPEVVTTLADPQGRPTIAPLLAAIPERVFAVGRLDYDAEGALIVTNDGALAHRLMHPSFGVPRVYLAKVKGVPSDATIDLARRGLRLEDGPVTPLEIEKGESAERNTWLKLVLTEGRPHLVKRLCAALGHPVVRLYRPLYGGVSAEGLRPGEFRALTPPEISLLKNGGRRPIPPVAELKAPPRRHRAQDDETPQAPLQQRQLDDARSEPPKSKKSMMKAPHGAAPAKASSRPNAQRQATPPKSRFAPDKKRDATDRSRDERHRERAPDRRDRSDRPMSARFTKPASPRAIGSDRFAPRSVPTAKHSAKHPAPKNRTRPSR